MKWALSLSILLFSFFCALQTVADDYAATYQRLKLEQLNDFEIRADDAREHYWEGRYQDALEIYDQLSQQHHASTILYKQSAALCCIRLGQFEAAKSKLVEAVQISEYFVDARGEKNALSKFGKESGKLYIGDPYEQSMRYLILALLYLSDGDYDNALAACKGGLLADSDAHENQYRSDIALLYLLEGKCHILRGTSSHAEDSFRGARDAYVATHDSVRDLASERVSLLAALRMTQKERGAQGFDRDEGAIQAQIQALTTKIDDAASGISCEEAMGCFLTGDYNTLVIVPQGQALIKTRAGQEADRVLFQSRHLSSLPCSKISYDDNKTLDDSTREVLDVDYQAMTRGGRRMDSILAGKASFKRGTVNVGGGLVSVGNNVGGVAGLAMVLVGAAVQGVGGAMTPEADQRCWQSLASKYCFYALNLSPGDHVFRVEHPLYYDRKVIFERSLLVPDEGLAIVLIPPEPCGLYTPQALASNRRMRRPKSIPGKPVWIIPPPLGLEKIERFESNTSKGKPKTLSPDPWKISRLIQSQLAKLGVNPVMLSHNAATEAKWDPSLQPVGALQITLQGLTCHVEQNSETYSCQFEFRVIEPHKGTTHSEVVIGTYEKGSKERITSYADVFYNCCEDALDQFVRCVEFFRATQAAPQTAGTQQLQGVL